MRELTDGRLTDGRASEAGCVCVQSGHGQDLNSFVNTLQRVAEERELLDLSSTILDDWVPEGVLSEYVTQVLRNMKLQVSDMDVLQGLLQQRPSRYHYSH